MVDEASMFQAIVLLSIALLAPDLGHTEPVDAYEGAYELAADVEEYALGAYEDAPEDIEDVATYADEQVDEAVLLAQQHLRELRRQAGDLVRDAQGHADDVQGQVDDQVASLQNLLADDPVGADQSGSGQTFEFDAPLWAWSTGLTVLVVAGATAASKAGASTSVFSWKLLRYLASLPLLGGFSRLTSQDVLAHPSREAIMSVVEREPGLTIQVLADRTGIARSTLAHHLRHLESHEKLRVQTEGRHAHVFPTTGAYIGDEERAKLRLLQKPETGAVARLIEERPGLTQREVAAEMGLSPATVCWHTKRLVEAGLVSAHRQGRTVQYTPA